MYHLENTGWKITQIGNSAYNGAHDFNITHRIHAPLGTILQHKTIKEVIEYIEVTYLSPCKFVGETINGVSRRLYNFQYAHDQESFADFWNGTELVGKVNGSWAVLI